MLPVCIHMGLVSMFKKLQSSGGFLFASLHIELSRSPSVKHLLTLQQTTPEPPGLEHLHT